MGFRVVDRLAERNGIPVSERAFGGLAGRGVIARAGDDPASVAVCLLEPLIFMNRSGDAVCEALDGLDIEDPGQDLLVVFDDVDLPFGRLRLRARGGAGGHRGLGDIIERIGRNDFARLRFGVGRPGEAQETTEHVLDPFSESEEAALPDHLTRAAEAIETTLTSGLTAAMNVYNRDPAPTDEAEDAS